MPRTSAEDAVPDAARLEARIAALEARQRELEDDREIRELLARFGFASDLGDADLYVDLFTHDGAIDFRAAADPAGALRWDGGDGVRAFIEDDGVRRIVGRSVHVQGANLRVRVDGDEAVAETYSLVLVAEADGLALTGAGFNRWSLRRVDGAWRIVERFRRAAGRTGYADALRESAGLSA